MLHEFCIFLGHFPGHPGCFFEFSTHPWDMYCILTCGWPMLFQIFIHQIMCVQPADALKILHFPGTFTWTWGLCSFGFWYILKMLQKFRIFPGHLPRHRVFFLGFLDTTSWRCSSFSWDIYTDMGLFFPGISANYIMQMLWFCLGHLPGHGGWLFRVFCTLHHPDAPAFLRTFTSTWGLFFFGFSAQYIMQMLWFCLGHLPGHRGCFLRVFHTLHHADAPVFLGTFTRTWGFFFWVFRTLHHADAPALLRTFTWTWGWFFRVFGTLHHADALGFLRTFTRTLGVVFFGFCTSCRCSGNSAFSWAIYPDTGVVIFGFSTHYIMQMLWNFLGHLPGHQGCFFGVFRTVLRHVLHFYLHVTYLIRTLTHEIICVHHADALDFLGTFTQTPGLFCQVFHTSLGHVPHLYTLLASFISNI